MTDTIATPVRSNIEFPASGDAETSPRVRALTIREIDEVNGGFANFIVGGAIGAGMYVGGQLLAGEQITAGGLAVHTLGGMAGVGLGTAVLRGAVTLSRASAMQGISRVPISFNGGMFLGAGIEALNC